MLKIRSVMITQSQTVSKDHVWVHGLYGSLGLCWCSWPVFLPKATWRPRICSHVIVRGLCCLQESSDLSDIYWYQGYGIVFAGQCNWSHAATGPMMLWEICPTNRGHGDIPNLSMSASIVEPHLGFVCISLDNVVTNHMVVRGLGCNRLSAKEPTSPWLYKSEWHAQTLRAMSRGWKALGYYQEPCLCLWPCHSHGLWKGPRLLCPFATKGAAQSCPFPSVAEACSTSWLCPRQLQHSGEQVQALASYAMWWHGWGKIDSPQLLQER